jgi:guanyl-specific ribonuclease Sa
MQASASLKLVSIELHAPTNSTQKLKLIGKGGQFTYTTNTPPHVQTPLGRIRGILEWTVIILINAPAVIILINAPARIRTRDLWLWYHIELHAPTNSTQKLKLIGKGGQFTYTPTISFTGFVPI